MLLRRLRWWNLLAKIKKKRKEKRDKVSDLGEKYAARIYIFRTVHIFLRVDNV